MARTKEFDRDAALSSAIAIFAEHGFAGTTTDELMRAMGIGRQSLYDTFGDKRALYLEALRRYALDNVGQLIRAMNTATSPVAGIEAAMQTVARQATSRGTTGCLGIGAVCEFGRSDDEVADITAIAKRSLSDALARRLMDAVALGEISAEVDVLDATAFLASTFSGLRISARSGANRAVLMGIISVAMRSLRD